MHAAILPVVAFYENVPRMLKDGTRAVIEKNSYPVLPDF